MFCASSLVVNILGFGLVIAMLAGAIAYIVFQKKKGNKCIGCPHSKSCSHSCKGAKIEQAKTEPSKNTNNQIDEEQNNE